MPLRIPEESLVAIEQAVAQHPEGARFGDIAEALPERLANRTLQYRLKYLVDKGRLLKEAIY
jgi:DNA-binding HxlR family transcriptional regulator